MINKKDSFFNNNVLVHHRRMCALDGSLRRESAEFTLVRRTLRSVRYVTAFTILH